MDKGFTLIELLIVSAILAILAGLTVPSLTSTYSDYVLTSEKDLASSLLRRTRSLAMAGFNDNDHGIKIASASYIEFEGTTYATRDASKDILTPRNADIAVSGSTEFVFSRLSGRSDQAMLILILDDLNKASISINQEGLINW